jgi:hypothetical protein
VDMMDEGDEVDEVDMVDDGGHLCESLRED